MPGAPTGFFTEISASALAQPGVATGTMMGFPCLRVSGAFFASCDPRSGDLIVKLPRERVEQLIASGAGGPFAPAGRTFREWVVIGDRDADRWAELIDEARVFVSGQ
ncbi:MmcQ/YjbR family DNA-binding protein [Streptomyces sp. TBY4]|uniref:MmcQ/YjbR family DNA-binding protein n=1 Tax=Streptomyces sp. TBY4 TaxID=2962030 RepID=UPI0020B6455C|nr:MmcQ/YjbR family DNA-binding protein [Streptomyces sp. TBY4]MCP3757254.1 MmcQ/YjbR family DNA-binding protein [Streptomyces sp. TBY4]